MNKSGKARATAFRLMDQYGPDRTLDLIDYWESTDVVDNEYAEQLRWEVYKVKKKKTPFTKYKKFHPYQEVIR